MKTLRIASLVIGGMLAIGPAAQGGGFGDVRFPSGRFNNTGSASASELKGAPSGAAANFYAPSDQSRAKHRHIRLNWHDYPFGLAVVNE
jgi:hypothetical protein